MRWQQARIAGIVPRSKTVSSFFFDLPEPFDFLAGQHVVVRLTAPDGYRAQRSYSIASAPGARSRIELAIERLDDGEVSPFFHDVAEVGDEIEIGGPIGGHFVWTVADGGPVLLIAGGAGVVPLLSMLRHRAGEGATTPMALLFSARTKADVLFREELSGLAARDDGFELQLTLTREASPPPGAFSRRIDPDMILEVTRRLPGPPRRAYICGSNAFCERAADGALAAGIDAGDIRTERYGA
ncbi:ferredoxin reductase [Arvimicrobium flavum]|uniref:ferredoxin reductase n=1 Tax=Arvimicrobium flavum TaxID=3393320 RepID=UPI00237AB473|nr:ferredoxin reductase [Mesorhizobium shangrilense]